MISLRDARAEDFDGIVEVFWSAWQSNVRRFGEPGTLDRFTHDDAVTLWRGALATGRALVAEQDGRIVGVTRFDVGGVELAVHSLYVTPQSQGDGIGSRLLDAAVAEARAAGVVHDQLWVFARNDARRFYARRGWRPDGAQRLRPQFGMDEIRLTRTGDDLTALAGALSSPGITATPEQRPPAGAVIAVRDADGDRWGCAGTHDGETAPMTQQTVFDLASVSKLLTTAGIMRLVDAGRVDLDAPAARYLTGLGEPMFTIRQLLQHRSGLLPWQPLYLQARSRDEALALIRTLPRRTPPDVEFAYSDLGFLLLGEVIETVTGQGLHDALAAMIFAPLGLSITGRPTGEIATSSYGSRVEQRQVETGVPYEVLLEPRYDAWSDSSASSVWRNRPLTGEVNDTNAHACFAGRSGHAGLFASMGDLLDLGSAFATTEHGLWRAETLAAFTAEGPDAAQGLGFRLRRLHEGSTMAYHPGFTGMALGVITGGPRTVPMIIALGTNRLLHRGDPVPHQWLFERVLQGVGVLDNPEPLR